MAGLFDKAKDLLNTEQGEKTSDSILDKAAQAADKATGGKHGEHIEKAEDAADQHLGSEGSGRPHTTDPTASRDRF
jgi:hypothetical protein